MTHPFRMFFAAMLLFVLVLPAQAQEPVDEQAVQLIRKHGLEQSQLNDVIWPMTEVYGPRLTGSPDLDEATEWVTQLLRDQGFNVSLHTWGPFGNGWTLKHSSMTVTSPRTFPVYAYPKSWSPGTNGVVEGEFILVKAESEADLAQYEGKLAGKIVLLEEPREVNLAFDPLARRHDAESLLRLANAGDPAPRSGGRNYSEEVLRRFRFQQQLASFIMAQKPLAIVDRGTRGDTGNIFVQGARSSGDEPAYRTDPAQMVPQFVLGVEHYNRIYRLLENGTPVQARLELDVEWDTSDPMEHNIIAEIPGTDPRLKDEVVMLGAHFDSWHGGDGATDNASGSSVMMEAMRILKETFAELGTSPRRTIRLALWTGEEQGLFGSRAYVADTFAEPAEDGQPLQNVKPEYEKFSAYYNLDNGTGKIRGVYLQGNRGVEPIFRAWLQPFRDLEASTLTLSNTGSTDHASFDAVGLPGFQFIQDSIEYGTRTHHSVMDVYDHLSIEDLQQAATIIASFVYHTAQRDERLPRKPRATISTSN